MLLFFLFGMHIYKSLKPLKLWLQMMIVIMFTECNLGEVQIKQNQLKIINRYLSLFWGIYSVLHQKYFILVPFFLPVAMFV